MNAIRIIYFLWGVLFCGALFACADDSSSEEYLPMDDSLFPYANLPRLVVETKDFQTVKNTEDYIDGKMQLYDAEAPYSDVVELVIRGRGNSSFSAPKNAYRIKLDRKGGLLGMPPNRDWVLIPNYMDKSLLRNFVASKMASINSSSWIPQSYFVELHFNRNYQGVYQLSEKIEVSKERVNLPKGGYLVEVDYKNKAGEQIVSSKSSVPFRVHYPKDAPDSVLDKLVKHINEFEAYLENDSISMASLGKWVDLESYIKYYWIQELSKNIDGAYKTSVFFTWDGKGPIVMGPIWDFDAAYGAAYATVPTGWLVRKKYWNQHLFKNEAFAREVRKYWLEHRGDYASIADSILSYGNGLALAARNNFERWPILGENTLLSQSVEVFDDYEQAVLSFRDWLLSRMKWIDEQYE